MKKKFIVGLAAAALAVIPASAALGDAHDTADVYVVHAVPGADVDVYVNGDLAIEGFAPTTVTDAISLPEGDYDIEVYAAGADTDADDPLITLSPSLSAGQSVTLVAHLLADGSLSDTLAVFPNDVSGADGQARVEVRHTAAAPEVEVTAAGDSLGTFEVGGTIGPVDVDAGTLPVGVGLPGDDPFFEADLELGADTATFVHAYVSNPEDPTGTFEPLVLSIELPVEDADDAEEMEAPDEEHSPGEAGLAATSLPTWVVALMALGALTVAAPVVARKRN